MPPKGAAPNNATRPAFGQSPPGNLSPSDWHLMLEVVEAVKAAIPDASNRPPRAVLEHVLDALGNCPTNGPSTNSSVGVLVVTAPAGRWISFLMLFC
jgi:hypothetical protein